MCEKAEDGSEKTEVSEQLDEVRWDLVLELSLHPLVYGVPSLLLFT